MLPTSTKSAIRRGRYRRIMVDAAVLAEESVVISRKLAPLLKLWGQNQLTDPDMAGFYILAYLQVRKPRHWLLGDHSQVISSSGAHGPRNPLSRFIPECFQVNENYLSRFSQSETMHSLFARCSLRSIPLAVNRALVAWIEGRYPLRLLTHVPTPYEVLLLQSRGIRCVTMVRGQSEMGALVLGQRDPFGFILHDLIHADHFFSNETRMKGQVGFSRLMQQAYEAGVFSGMLQADEIFKKEFEYVIGDMNSYCVHLLKCLRAVLTGFFLRQEAKHPNDQLSTDGKAQLHAFISELLTLWEASAEIRAAVLKLNTSHWAETDFAVIQEFLEKPAATGNIGLDSGSDRQ